MTRPFSGRGTGTPSPTQFVLCWEGVVPWLDEALALLPKSSLRGAEGRGKIFIDGDRGMLRTWFRQHVRACDTIGLFPEAWQPRAVFFDMDSTLIQQETIVELAAQCGRGEEVARVTESAMRGEMDFAAALRQRLALLRGMPEKAMEAARERLTLSRGVRDFCKRARANGIDLFLVSGGFLTFAAPLARELDFRGVHAHTLKLEHGAFTGEVVGSIIDAAEKKRWMLATCASAGIGPDEACAIGDGANDLPMLQAAGFAVAFAPKPLLAAHADCVVGTGDLSFLERAFFQ